MQGRYCLEQGQPLKHITMSGPTKFALLLPLFFALLLVFCRKETITTDPEDILSFSTDTLRFDTVFTELGSATRFFKVYNPHRSPIRISKIYLENGESSRFRLNVDGLPGNIHEQIDVAPQDSLYIFAEVTINPNAPPSASPFVIQERLIFETNSVKQAVTLEAYGQNAVYLPSRFDAGKINLFTCNGGEWVWNDPRPYVVYGVLVIDDCTVRIPAGARIHVHGGLAKQETDTSKVIYNDGFIAFRGNGRLIVEGTLNQPVVIEGDRLESEFANSRGQWTGIWLQSGTTGHQLEHCIVRNSIIGIRADSATDLRMRNCQIYNTASSGLIGIHADITAENCLFFDNVGYSIQLEYGGRYRFDYCTAASYGVNGAALFMGNVRCFDPGCQQFAINQLDATFRNCILSGSRADQIALVDRLSDRSRFAYRFEHCIVRARELLKPNAWPDFKDNCQPCLYAELRDTVFINPDRDLYRLDTMHSIANGFAKPISGIDVDLDGKFRDPSTPDAGCYENEF